MARSRYTPTGELFLWFLGDPARPAFVGTLHLLTSRGVSLRYDERWAAQGFALSEDLPLSGGAEHLPAERDAAAGAVDDARPDRWGERVIRFLDKPPRLSLLEYLYFAGDGRFGALGISTSRAAYEPCPRDPLPALADLPTLHEVVRKVLANEPVAERERRLLVPGGTLGGARPKDEVRAEIRAVARVIDTWKEHFSRAGVRAADIDAYAEQIDRPFLRDQRRDA